MGPRRTTEAGTFHIRPATETDLPGVLGCLRESFEPYRADYTPAAFADTVPSEGDVRERFRGMTILVAEDPAGAIVGTIACAAASAAEGHLRGLAVRPD